MRLQRPLIGALLPDEWRWVRSLSGMGTSWPAPARSVVADKDKDSDRDEVTSKSSC